MRPVEEHTFRTHDGVDLSTAIGRPFPRLRAARSCCFIADTNIPAASHTSRTNSTCRILHFRLGRARSRSLAGDRGLQPDYRHLGA